MIDNLDQVDLLLCKLEDCLPIIASPTPALNAKLGDVLGASRVPRQWRVTRVDYAGDEGGLVCHIESDPADNSNALFVSITHLVFDRRTPCAREIVAYQKHRIKRLRRSAA